LLGKTDKESRRGRSMDNSHYQPNSSLLFI